MPLTIADLRAAKIKVRLPGQRGCRRQRASPEHDAQVAVFSWASNGLVQRRYPVLELLYAVPNGEKRDWKVAQRLKKEGVKPGIPDLHLPIRRGQYIGLYIEMKAGRNRPTPLQKRKIALLLAEGHHVVVAYSADEAIREIEWYLNLGAGQ